MDQSCRNWKPYCRGGWPEVSLAAVIGRSDAKWGERPVSVFGGTVSQAGGPSSDEKLLASLRGRVASWWIPTLLSGIDKHADGIEQAKSINSPEKGIWPCFGLDIPSRRDWPTAGELERSALSAERNK